MKKTSIAQALVFVLLIAFASFSIAQKAGKPWEKTVKLPSGELILDMSGYTLANIVTGCKIVYRVTAG
jgi:TRAP-type C4-dicarboxylate transport system permease small subunit